MRHHLLVAFAAAALAVSPAQAGEAKPFATSRSIDLLTLLKPPPANDSAQTKAELGEVLGL